MTDRYVTVRLHDGRRSCSHRKTIEVQPGPEPRCAACGGRQALYDLRGPIIARHYLTELPSVAQALNRGDGRSSFGSGRRWQPGGRTPSTPGRDRTQARRDHRMLRVGRKSLEAVEAKQRRASGRRFSAEALAPSATIAQALAVSR